MIIAISTAIPLLAAGLAVGSSLACRPRRRGGSDLGRGIGLIVAAAAAVFAGEEYAVYVAMVGCAWIVVWLIIGSIAAGKAASRIPQS